MKPRSKTETRVSPLSAPEVLFGVEKANAGVGRSVEQEMKTSEWMLADDGSVCISALCVLADSSFGNAIVVGRPHEYWPVTADLSLDVADNFPQDNSRLFGESWPIRTNIAGGLAQGRIVDAKGQLVAVGTTRLRYIPFPRDFDHHDRFGSMSHGVPSPDWASTAEALGISSDIVGGQLSIYMPCKPVLLNSVGVVHGGVLLSAIEIAGRSSLQLQCPELRTSSLRVSYVRPTSGEGTAVFTSAVQHCGQRFGVAHVIGYDNSGRTCTVATVTCHA